MYRIRKMFLVNVGTNKQRPSRRITEIDPRDGAAVVGPNGVGKTTTLRLIPLFYGHLPSQIIQIGHGQKSMPRFTLPTPDSEEWCHAPRSWNRSSRWTTKYNRTRSILRSLGFEKTHRCR